MKIDAYRRADDNALVVAAEDTDHVLFCYGHDEELKRTLETKFILSHVELRKEEIPCQPK